MKEHTSNMETNQKDIGHQEASLFPENIPLEKLVANQMSEAEAWELFHSIKENKTLKISILRMIADRTEKDGWPEQLDMDNMKKEFLKEIYAMCDRLGMKFPQEFRIDGIGFILSGGTTTEYNLCKPTIKFCLGIERNNLFGESIPETLRELLESFGLFYAGGYTYMRYQLDGYDILIEAIEGLMRKLTNKR